jgi:hypothetical protein
MPRCHPAWAGRRAPCPTGLSSRENIRCRTAAAIRRLRLPPPAPAPARTDADAGAAPALGRGWLRPAARKGASNRKIPREGLWELPVGDSCSPTQSVGTNACDSSGRAQRPPRPRTIARLLALLNRTTDRQPAAATLVEIPAERRGALAMRRLRPVWVRRDCDQWPTGGASGRSRPGALGAAVRRRRRCSTTRMPARSIERVTTRLMPRRARDRPSCGARVSVEPGRPSSHLHSLHGRPATARLRCDGRRSHRRWQLPKTPRIEG